MSALLKLSPVDFCNATDACSEGRDYALTQPTMIAVWDNCPSVEWLLWICRKVKVKPDDRTLRLFAVWCARNTPLVDGRKTGDLITDPRSLAALEVAERYANGLATNDELVAARDAAAAAGAAWYAAWDAARDAAWDAARDAAGAAAGDAWAAQATHFRTLVPNPFNAQAVRFKVHGHGDLL